MQFLHRRRPGGGDAQADICRLFQRTAVSSGQPNRFQSETARQLHGQQHVAGISGCRDAQKDIARPAQCQDLLGKDKVCAQIVGRCRADGRLADQRDRRQAQLQLIEGGCKISILIVFIQYFLPGPNQRRAAESYCQ